MFVDHNSDDIFQFLNIKAHTYFNEVQTDNSPSFAVFNLSSRLISSGTMFILNNLVGEFGMNIITKLVSRYLNEIIKNMRYLPLVLKVTVH